MKEIFDRSLELNGMITDMKGKCSIINIEVNSAMEVYIEHGRKSDKFLATRFLELAEDLAKYGIIEKEWKDED